MLHKSDFFTYLTADSHDDWGIEVTTAGHQHAAPHTKYPPLGHPKSHAFEWKKGRQLNEYHMVYIPTGAGECETRRQRVAVNAGDLILILPKDWHRYRPLEDTGWEAYWVGFKGSYINKYVRRKLFTRGESFLRSVGYRPDLVMLFDQLIDLSKREGRVLKTASLGCLLQILAYARAPAEAKTPARPDSPVADPAIALIRQNLFTNVNFQQMAATFGLSYSRFRSLFKAATGLAPHQFLLSERIACAKRLLRNPAIEIKTVGYKTGFHSASYFSKIFSRKTGTTPSAARTTRE